MDHDGNRTVEPRAGIRPPQTTQSTPNVASHVVPPRPPHALASETLLLGRL